MTAQILKIDVPSSGYFTGVIGIPGIHFSYVEEFLKYKYYTIGNKRL